MAPIPSQEGSRDMAAGSLRPNIVRVMSANRERPLRTQEIYEAVAKTGVAGFDPRAKRDRNPVNRELSDLAAMIPESHSKPTPQLLARVGRGPLHLQGAWAPHGPRVDAGIPGAGGGLREAAAARATFKARARTGGRIGADGAVCGAAGHLPWLWDLPAPPLPAL